MTTNPAHDDTIPPHWLARPWNTGDHRHILGDGRELDAGELITVVWADPTGDIRAEVRMILTPEHADQIIREHSGFDTFAAARYWAEANDADLQAILDDLPWDADRLEAVTTTQTEQEAEDAAQLAALANGQAAADRTADYWAGLAATLTDIRADAHRHLPDLPHSQEEWMFESMPHLPFQAADLHMQLQALSGLITKAHTVAAIYRQKATYLADEYAAVAPD